MFSSPRPCPRLEHMTPLLEKCANILPNDGDSCHIQVFRSLSSSFSFLWCSVCLCLASRLFYYGLVKIWLGLSLCVSVCAPSVVLPQPLVLLPEGPHSAVCLAPVEHYLIKCSTFEKSRKES